MTIDYTTLLTTEQKREILLQGISQFAAEAYQHSLNKITYESLNDAGGVENANNSIAILEAAINTNSTELAELGDAQ